MPYDDFTAVVLAAGESTRIKGSVPKILIEIAGRPIIAYVLATLRKLPLERIYVIVGRQAKQVKKYIHKICPEIRFIIQKKRLGTAHALKCAETILKPWGKNLIVLCGDTPLLTHKTLKKLIAKHKKCNTAVTVLTAIVKKPSGYGRIKRNKERNIIDIIEEKDATYQEKKIKEINTGVYCFCNDASLWSRLKKIKPDNAQKEYYLTDIVKICAQENVPISSLTIRNEQEILGVNTPEELITVENIIKKDKVIN